MTFEPFPSRNALIRRHEAHMQKVEATYKEEEKWRAAAQRESQKKEFLNKKVWCVFTSCCGYRNLLHVASHQGKNFEYQFAERNNHRRTEATHLGVWLCYS